VLSTPEIYQYARSIGQSSYHVSTFLSWPNEGKKPWIGSKTL